MRFEDLTVGQYIKLVELDKDKSLDALDLVSKQMAIVTGRRIEEIELMDINYIKSKIAFLKKIPTEIPFKKSIWIGFKQYTPSINLVQTQVNQLTDFYSLYKNEAPINEILAVIYKPKNGKYHADNHSYVAKKMINKRIGDVLGAVFFSLNYYKRCEKLINQYLENNQLIINQVMTEITTDKEFQAFLNTGDGNITSTSAQKMNA